MISRELFRENVRRHSLKFLDGHRNICFLGGNGIGKTHLLIALGYQASTTSASSRPSRSSTP